MKRILLHKVLVIMMLGNIFFTQLITGMLHEHEDIHHAVCEDADVLWINESDHEVCTICALHFAQDLFYLDPCKISFNCPVMPWHFSGTPSYGIHYSFSPPGRAPPAFII